MHRRVDMYPGACVHIGVDVVAAVLAGDVGELAVSTSGGRQDVCGDLHMPPKLVTVRARQVRVVPRPGVQPTTSGVSNCSGGEHWRAVASRALRCGPAPTALKEARHGTARFGPGARRRFCR